MSRRRKRHSPEQTIRTLRDADAMLAGGKTIGEVCQALETSEQTFHRWRNQYGGMKAEEAAGVQTLYIEPGSLGENGYAESFNSRFRDELLAREEWDTLCEARAYGTRYRLGYNYRRPPHALGYRTPAEFGPAVVPQLVRAPARDHRIRWAWRIAWRQGTPPQAGDAPPSFRGNGTSRDRPAPP